MMGKNSIKLPSNYTYDKYNNNSKCRRLEFYLELKKNRKNKFGNLFYSPKSEINHRRHRSVLELPNEDYFSRNHPNYTIFVPQRPIRK